jgi:glycerol kinase
MQRQADLLGVTCVRPAMLETTALGAAFLAGLGVGLWPDLTAVSQAWREDRRFTRTLDADDVAARVAGWKAAIART